MSDNTNFKEVIHYGAFYLALRSVFGPVLAYLILVLIKIFTFFILLGFSVLILTHGHDIDQVAEKGNPSKSHMTAPTHMPTLGHMRK